MARKYILLLCLHPLENGFSTILNNLFIFINISSRDNVTDYIKAKEILNSTSVSSQLTYSSCMNCLEHQLSESIKKYHLTKWISPTFSNTVFGRGISLIDIIFVCRYVVVENLRYMLSEHNTSDPIYFGCRFRPYVKQGYMSGGAGK